ncbi:hypothetical protein JCM19038_2996 [Geomicrobium sp. JCM 19038]|nr:hypothetical protein JCM19038_2996 [Geomicrobium sp. JCM 19038]
MIRSKGEDKIEVLSTGIDWGAVITSVIAFIILILIIVLIIRLYQYFVKQK